MPYLSLVSLLCLLSGLWTMPPAPVINKVLPKQIEVRVCIYSDQPISTFFKSLVRNHLADFARLNGRTYDSICRQFGLDSKDSCNLTTYYTLDIVHKLYTAKTCTDGSRGEILNIPYYWHWVTPNPRHEIFFTDNGNPLTSVNHPPGFERYATFADIDRTPYLYLTDLFSPKPKYYSPDFDTFSTFGWCSEREMAFVSLLTLMGFSANVIAPGNHSWSQVIVKMKCLAGDYRSLQATIDNTFDIVAWTEPDPDTGHCRYDITAHSQAILKRLRTFTAPSAAMCRIEEQVVKYLKKSAGSCRKD